MEQKGKKEMTGGQEIIVRGARTHNLKNVTVSMPRNKMVVFTGLSGSGKSSLAFDTIFAEGQRRYVESLSTYARQFLRQMQKPDVDEISGLSPAISIDQKSRSNNPRSTVATITEIYDYLRVLFARVGKPHCIVCGEEIQKLSNDEILNFILDAIRTRAVKPKRVSKKIMGAKFREGEITRTDFKDKSVLGVVYAEEELQIFAPLVRGRKGEYYQLLYDLLSKGFSKVRVDGKMKSLREQIILEKNKKHNIEVLVDAMDILDFKKDPKKGRERLAEAVERALHEAEGLVTVLVGEEERVMSVKFACKNDGFSYPEIEPRLFSFNSPYGACDTCNGLGTKHLFGDEPCPACLGVRLRQEALNVRIGNHTPDLRVGQVHKPASRVGQGKNIVDITRMSVVNAADFFADLKLSVRDKEVSKVVIREIESRLHFLLDVGLEYLTLDRRAHTLSGGEAQRIRLASQLGSQLVGALYVLDEPTIGLHQRDNDRLIKTLKNLRDLGNTIIVVEHDEDTIYSADYIVDIGPGAGVHGGHIVVADYLEPLLAAKKNISKSITLAYLRDERTLPIPAKRRETPKGALQIRGGNIFNIKNLDVDVPLGKLTVITGVSGSGKSTFLYEIIHKNLQGRFEQRYRTNEIFNCESFSGTEYASRTILIDQTPIGRTPRSNPATYTGAFTFVRELFASTEEARVRGWGAARFSFNVPAQGSSATGGAGGRCEACQGNGEVAVEMHFLPTVYVTCDVCRGKRFDKETLEVKYKKKNIYEVLRMTAEEAILFFEDIPAIYDRLKTLDEVGLGYLLLGQSATTLSGGEAQRVKISSELYRPHLQKTVYLLDEPTVGLHYEDVGKLMEILQRLVDKGNTVIVIEHNMDVVKSADYILDFGPEGGDGGGRIIAKGTPEQVAQSEKSHTGRYLKKVLAKARHDKNK